MLTLLIGRFLLDTNIIIALFKRDPVVLQRVQEAVGIAISVTVLGELYFGAFNSGRTQANIAQIEGFITDTIVYSCDTETARYYGEIRNQLRIKGKPIPENDMWIAAVAMQHGLTLVTRDAHFAAIDNLTVANW